MTPIVGGEMTHPKYLMKDGGYVYDKAPIQMYQNGAKAGADHFVIPGNKPNIIENYVNLLSEIVEFPKICMPGIGRQGGDIQIAFKAMGKNPAYAIIGSGIYNQKNIGDAAKKFCDMTLQFQ